LSDKEQLRKRLEELKALSGLTYQERGYKLEVLICDLLDAEDLNPERPFRVNGEQIDGFFEMDGRFFLLESKWHKHELPVSEIYAFKAKVEGKLIGTVGVFVLMSGFSLDVSEALRYGKEINTPLFDGDDIESAIQNDCSFKKILQIKLRRAAQRGEVYYSYKRHLDSLTI